MMYSNSFAVAIKINGKVLREISKDQVVLPFGSEYEVYLKNLASVRAQVTITVDGQEVVAGLVMQPNSETTIERFVKDLNIGNKLKFIERTENIEQYRGIKIDDGLLRIEFQFEKKPPVIRHEYVQYYEPYYRMWPHNGPITYGYLTPPSGMPTMDSYSKGFGVSVNNMAGAAQNFYSTSLGATADCIPTNDVGVTVAGSESLQKFTTVSGFPLEDTKHVMIVKLIGQTPENRKVVQPITVDIKKKCTTCAKVNKHSAKFCSACGTALRIF